MRSKLIKGVFALAAVIIIIVAFNVNFKRKAETNIFILPSLPQPIAKEAALITSAGQSTDAYIVRDVANQMMIRNFFMPQAKETDMSDIKTLVFVVGYSPLGAKLNGTSYEEEKIRIRGLLEKAKSSKVPVITVFIGGEQRREQKTNELLQLVGAESDYIIATLESDQDSFLSKLAGDNHIPLTLVNGVNDVSEPFTSAFR